MKASESKFIRVPIDIAETRLTEVLSHVGFSQEKAIQLAKVFVDNSRDGVPSHGLNRFARFVQDVKAGNVRPGAEPVLKHASGAVEQWDGMRGAGPLNAMVATDRAVALAREHGIGCVGLSQSNHWMRGGYYGWRGAKAGCLFIGWSNTVRNMPAWGARDCRLGNNPIVIAVPRGDDAVVLDMAMSQFSYGALEVHRLRNDQLPIPGGYDTQGILTEDPAAILATGRLLPMGFWKGSGLALLLDIFAAILSGGLATCQMGDREGEYGLSQVFILIDPSTLTNGATVGDTVDAIIRDYSASQPESDEVRVLYPGERVLRDRAESIMLGIQVHEKVWEEIRAL